MSELDILISQLSHSIDVYGKEQIDAQEILDFMEAIQKALREKVGAS